MTAAAQQAPVTTWGAFSNYLSSSSGQSTVFDTLECAAAWGKYLVSPISKAWFKFDKVESMAGQIGAGICVVPLMSPVVPAFFKHSTILLQNIFYMGGKLSFAELCKEVVKVARLALEVIFLSAIFAMGLHGFGVLNLALYTNMVVLPIYVSVAIAIDEALAFLTTTLKLRGWFAGQSIARQQQQGIDPYSPQVVETLENKRQWKRVARAMAGLHAGVGVALAGLPFTSVVLGLYAAKLASKVGLAMFREFHK